MPFSVTKWPICPEQFFLLQTIIITFIYLLALFIVKNSLQILKTEPKLWECPILETKKVHMSQRIFFIKLFISFSSNYSPFRCAKFQKNPSRGSRVMRLCNFWAYNGPFDRMRIFSENLLMNLVPFIHAYLHAKNQSQILIY